MQVLLNIAPLYLLALLAYLLKARKVLPAETANVLIPILFKVCGPALAFVAISGQIFNATSLVLIALGAGAVLIFVGVFSIFSRRLIAEESTQKVLMLGGISFAGGTIAYPLIQLSFNSAVFAQAVIIDLTLLVVFMALAPVLVSKENGTKRLQETLLKDPIFWAVYLGILVSIFHLAVPEWIMKVASFASGSFSFVSAVLLGVTVALPSLLQLKKVTSGVSIKLVLGILLCIIVWYLPLPLITRQAFVLMVSSPIGMFPIVYCAA